VERAVAAVLVRTGPDAAFELRDFPLPSLGADDGLLRVERCGICGSDYRRFCGQQAEGAGLDQQDRRPLPAIATRPMRLP